MKKLLAILVLGLLWSDDIFAKTDKKISLENCADKKFLEYDFEDKYAHVIGPTLGIIVSWMKEDKNAEKWLKSSRKIKKKLDNEKLNHKGEITKELKKKWESESKLMNDHLIKGHKEYEKIAEKIIKKTSLKRKSKETIYIKLLTDCEKKYNETPTAFILKWQE